MMSLPFLAAKLPLGSSIAVNYNEQSKIRQVTISKSSPCEPRDKSSTGLVAKGLSKDYR